MVSAIGGLIFNTMPILLGTAGEAFGFNNAELGNLSLMAGVGYLAGTLTGPLWVDSFQWQKTALLIILAVAFSFLVSMRIPGEYVYYGF